MTGSTKILTVSYGTFSCTLEGFDDPFGTMRGIAEYFRDLAADDRYFGAEPPTPDVEMLQRIAEKEVQRRVEARLGDSGVALTQLTGVKDDAARPAAEAEAADEVAETVAEAPKRPVSQPRREPEVADFDRGPLAQEEEYLLSDEPEDVLAVDPDARPPAEGPAETVAEKLRRIRAVVSRSIEPEAGSGRGPFSEPQAPSASDDGEVPKRERALTETIRQITEDLSDDDDDDDEAMAGAASAANLFDDGDDLDAEEPDADLDDDDTDSDAATAFEAASGTAEPFAGEEPDIEDAPELEDAPADVDASAEEPWETVAEDDAGDGWDFDTDGLPAATAGTDDAVEDDDDSDDSRSDDAVLAKVMARDERPKSETEAPDVLKLDSDSAVTPSADERRTTKPLTPISETEGDVGRLLAETDNHLKDDEGIRRRRVISQMRAAVAATKADRLVSRRVQAPEVDDAAEQERYRDDLNEVVRDVTRPQPDEETGRRTSAAPLVLVSSQRVDHEATQPPKPEPTQTAGEPEGFAGFARNMGARELPELLEAAAAYTSFVEGQSSFSRPEIMKRVARVDPTLKLSREDGLRSFGQLLRQGTFRKLERGQFTISETTRFKPEQRIAGE